MINNNEVFNLKADCYLLHNRKIPNRVDDSVVRLWKKHIFFLRKSRGFVPDSLKIPYKSHILSVGAGENICGALSSDQKLYATQYIGNSKYYPTVEFLEQSLRHLMNLSSRNKMLDAVVMDLHPAYNSRSVAKTFAKEFSAPLYEIQHHYAHAASLLLDNNLDESVVLALDGLGYGNDKTFWGGEVLSADFQDFERIGHLEYIPLLGGDQATYDPRRLVYAIFHTFGKEKYFTGNDAALLNKIQNKSPMSSSLGRILDALSCYLNICTQRTYDGEPAMKLETYLALGKDTYRFDSKIKDNVVGTVDLFRQLDEMISPNSTEKEKADVSYSFVKTIVDSLCDIATTYAHDNNISSIGLTGGVSYNAPINDMVERQVRKSGLKMIVHNKIPNGDGGIAIGQNIIVGNRL
jgi:hydrogenase maturation protein HypF